MNAKQGYRPENCRRARAACALAAVLVTSSFFASQFGLAHHYGQEVKATLAASQAARLVTARQPARQSGARS